MRLPDVNVLVHAHRDDLPEHEACRAWLTDVLNGEETYAVTDVVINGFLRLVTNPRVFKRPTPLERALAVADQVRNQPHGLVLAPGGRHWGIFTRLCRHARATGGLVTDAYLAAIAIEHGCEFVTLDRDFARFPGLRLSSPLD
jgi:toxin-antitoxin system PIN domain toxin